MYGENREKCVYHTLAVVAIHQQQQKSRANSSSTWTSCLNLCWSFFCEALPFALTYNLISSFWSHIKWWLLLSLSRSFPLSPSIRFDALLDESLFRLIGFSLIFSSCRFSSMQANLVSLVWSVFQCTEQKI